MKKLIIITGDLAVGKSRFAEMLSKRYNSCVMYKDKIKEIMGDTVGFANREENLRLSVATVALMTYGLSEMTKIGADVILEANFKEEELQRIDTIAKEAEYDTLTLVIRADMDIIYKRFVNRIENENRHPVHISGFDGYDTLKFYIEKGRKHSTFGRVMEINANDFSYQTDTKILAEIDSFIYKNEGN